MVIGTGGAAEAGQQGQPPKAKNPKQAKAASAITAGHNLWDFLIVAVVIGAFVGIIVFLALHYTKVSNVATVLGIGAPVFAAVFGVTIGYTTGNSSGKATGKAQGKQEVKDALMPRVSDLAKSSGELVDTLSQRATSPPGSSRWLLQEDFRAQPLELAPDNMELKTKVASLSSYVEAL
jgi:hypothetical protein